MPTINGRACIVNGAPVDKVFSNGRQVYGRNYIKNSHADYQKLTIDVWTGYTGIKIPITSMGVSAGDKITFALWIESPSEALAGTGPRINLVRADNTYMAVMGTDYILPGETGYRTITATIQADTISVQLFLQRQGATAGGTKFNVYIKREKLDTGTVATPWTPAPEDVGNK